MHFFRHSTVRNTTLFILLSWGLLVQVATVYACEAENGKKQLSCCCEDLAEKSDCKHGKSKCDSQIHNFPGDLANSCCDMTFGVPESAVISSNSTSAAQQVLSLAASQPPPILANNHAISPLRFASLTLPRPLSPIATGTNTYLHTQRVRI